MFLVSPELYLAIAKKANVPPYKHRMKETGEFSCFLPYVCLSPVFLSLPTSGNAANEVKTMYATRDERFSCL